MTQHTHVHQSDDGVFRPTGGQGEDDFDSEHPPTGVTLSTRHVVVDLGKGPMSATLRYHPDGHGRDGWVDG